MYIILKGGGFTTGGLNFDAHIRRQSIDYVDLFYAHIGAMDTFARGLKSAARMIKDKVLENSIELSALEAIKKHGNEDLVPLYELIKMTI